jgi:WD40 repeat protein
MLRELRVHADGVTDVQFADEILFSGSRDGAISATSLLTGESVALVKSPTVPIAAIAILGGTVVSAGIDHKIRIYNTQVRLKAQTYSAGDSF